MAGKKNRSGIWIMVVAAVVLEGTACVQYFASRAAIKQESMERATCELRKAELEIENHALEIETAEKTLALLVEEHLEDLGLVKFYDPESTETLWVDTGSASVRRVVDARAKQQAEQTERTMHRYGIDMATLYTGEDFVKPLRTLLSRRS